MKQGKNYILPSLSIIINQTLSNRHISGEQFPNRINLWQAFDPNQLFEYESREKHRGQHRKNPNHKNQKRFAARIKPIQTRRIAQNSSKTIEESGRSWLLISCQIIIIIVGDIENQAIAQPEHGKYGRTDHPNEQHRYVYEGFDFIGITESCAKWYNRHVLTYSKD